MVGKQSGLRTFYTIIITQVLSQIGSRISGLAIGIWLFNETGNATPLTMVAFFSVLPMVLTTGLSGVLADRGDRRLIMAAADAGQALGTVILLILFLGNGFQLWYLYVITFLQAIFGSLQGPAFNASVTMLVPDEHRDRANAIQQLTGPSSGIIAPAVTGVIYAAFGVVGAITIDLLTFLVAVIIILRSHIPLPEQTDEGREASGNMLQQMLGGIKYLLNRRVLFGLMLYISVLNFLLSGIGALMTPYLLSRTGDEAQLGILLSFMNGGALIGGIFMSVWGGTRPRIHGMMLGASSVCIVLMLVGVSQSFPALAIMLLILLIPTPIINASFMSMLQVKVAPDLQGRVFATVSQVAMLMMPLSFLISGPLADNVFEPMVQTDTWTTLAPFFGSEPGAGMGLFLTISGALALIMTVGVYAMPSMRKIETTLPDYIAKPAAEVEPPPEVPDLATI